MLDQTEGQIFLSEKRELSIINNYRSFSSIKEVACGNLIKFDDDTLKGGADVKITASQNCKVVIIPIVGAIELTDATGKNILIDAGGAYIFSISKGETYTIKNIYAEEMVNFVQIHQTNNGLKTPPKEVSFDLDFARNTLLPVGNGVHIGKYEGRSEDTFQLYGTIKSVFGFVVEGAFEFQNRLLETRDALLITLNNANEKLQIEFEALSNNAIIIIIEVETKA
ncbi:hypothetical protein [Emticicia sp. TH156]|uniref:hypothetical protein n=1 Tax=Emticicia sp. TH156 TaxID=2067454 RepID=UPI000C77A4B1|nr:hypothetical protein [Emticicia sp. TH156]PLK43725.1 hypothetical protein C0V77_14520 [Emticicia sp. TH156]